MELTLSFEICSTSSLFKLLLLPRQQWTYWVAKSAYTDDFESMHTTKRDYFWHGIQCPGFALEPPTYQSEVAEHDGGAQGVRIDVSGHILIGSIILPT